MGKQDDTQVEITSGDAPERVVRVSHPSRVVFPATDITPAITKLELVHYIVAMGDPLMRVLRDRPTTLERWPNGVQLGMRLGRGRDDGGFYQKHMMRGARELVKDSPTNSASFRDHLRRSAALSNLFFQIKDANHPSKTRHTRLPSSEPHGAEFPYSPTTLGPSAAASSRHTIRSLGETAPNAAASSVVFMAT